MASLTAQMQWQDRFHSRCRAARTFSSICSSYQMVWPPSSFVFVFLASGCFHGCSPLTVQYHTCPYTVS